MEGASNEGFCKSLGIDITYFKGRERLTISCEEGRKDLLLYKDHFCLKRKNESVSLLKDCEEVEKNFASQAACLNCDSY